MIVFDPFWQYLKEQQITTYDLEYQYGLNPSDISRLKHNHNYTIKSIGKFCELFSCQPGEILLYYDDKNLSVAKKEIIIPTSVKHRK